MERGRCGWLVVVGLSVLGRLLPLLLIDRGGNPVPPSSIQFTPGTRIGHRSDETSAATGQVYKSMGSMQENPSLAIKKQERRDGEKKKVVVAED